jgi:hypothetical protein
VQTVLLWLGKKATILDDLLVEFKIGGLSEVEKKHWDRREI